MLDEKRRTIPGIEAHYGHAWKATYNEEHWEKSSVKMKIWPAKIGVPHRDPKFHYDSSNRSQLVRELTS